MPKLQIELTEEEYRRLSDWTLGQGQTVEAWLRDSLRDLVERRANAQARIQAFAEWIQRYASDEAPPVPTEVLRREILYREVEP